MLFTTSIIWQNLEVYEDEIQEWIEYATGNESWSACDQPIREENGFDKKKAEETYVWLVTGLFLQETLLILVTYHPRNGMKNKAEALYNVYCQFYVNVNAVTW